jgi:hypothetical protein
MSRIPREFALAPRTTTKRPVEVPDFEGVPEVAPTVLKSVQGLLAAHASSDHELAKAVLKALRPRDGRSQRCTRDELPERLEQDGVTFDPDELDEVLSRLWDVGQIVLAQRNTGYPLFIVVKGVRALDDIDVLAADVCSAVKRRGEQFDDEDQLRSWLDEDGIGYDLRSLAVALRQLEELGRITRPVQEWSSVPRSPGVYVPPRIYNGP